MKQKIIEVRKKTAIPVLEAGGKKKYIRFKKGDYVAIKILKVKK